MEQFYQYRKTLHRTDGFRAAARAEKRKSIFNRKESSNYEKEADSRGSDRHYAAGCRQPQAQRKINENQRVPRIKTDP